MGYSSLGHKESDRTEELTLSLSPKNRTSQVAPASAEDSKRRGFDPWVGKIPWRRAWQAAPIFLPGESHGERSLVGYGPWGRKESDTTEAA